MTNNTFANSEGGANTSSQNKGIFIVIEGVDGTGKTTQFNKLTDHLVSLGLDVAKFDFPRYSQPSSHFIKEYLNGKYGGINDVGPYTSSLFFALDRYEAAPEIRKALDAGKIVIANRFTGSNMAHMGTKFNNVEERRGFFIWLDNLEFQMLKIPRPDKSYVLRLPAEVAQQLVDKKTVREYTDKKRDLHEADLQFLKRSVEVYDDLCQLFPKDFERVDCMRSEELLSIDEIHKIIWEKIEPMLPTKPETKTIDSGKEDKEYLTKDKDGNFNVLPAGQKYLENVVTNTSDNVYAFNDQLSPTTIAAAMARLSRRGDDMRITILDEFAKLSGKDEKLLQRVITAYGDDSVQQLVGQHVVVENSSNLLTKKLEWGRLAAYLEQSTRYIFFDQKDKNGHYKYYVPEYLDEKTKDQYIKSMDNIFDTYSVMVRKLTEYVRSNDSTPQEERDIAWKGATRAQACDAIRPVLPVATTATVGIYASGQALESLIMHLMSDDLPEAQITGKRLLEESRKVIPTFLERADKPDRGGATIAYRSNTFNKIDALSKKYLSGGYGQYDQPVTLVDYWPKNELELVPDMLYEHSNLSLEEIRQEVEGLDYKKREDIYKAYMGERLNRRHRPGRALEKAHYNWDIVCDYGIFRDLQRHRMVDDLEWQPLTPRYGFDIPKLVEEADLTEVFESCFDISLKLHSLLQSKGYALEAQYATLLGHKMRWKVTLNAREMVHFIELRTSPQGHPGYRKLCQQMYDALREVHPLLAESMKFVNKGEDAELTRLAAERYTQYKLSQMD